MLVEVWGWDYHKVLSQALADGTEQSTNYRTAEHSCFEQNVEANVSLEKFSTLHERIETYARRGMHISLCLLHIHLTTSD
eukprot:1064098-Amphidinium_carterae.1